MSAASNFLENKLVDWFFRGQAISITGASAAAGTGPTALYVGLLTAAPSDVGGGTEVTGGSYARVTVNSNTTNWAATNGATSTVNPSTGTGGTTSNNAVISFPSPSADWGTVTHFGIYDATSAGNLLFWGPLSSSKAVFTGDAVSIQISQLQVQMDD
jgi:hypothetical protein